MNRRRKPWETAEYFDEAAATWEAKLREAHEAIANGVAEQRHRNCIAIADSWIKYYRDEAARLRTTEARAAGGGGGEGC
jgi:hypothetical protein